MGVLPTGRRWGVAVAAAALVLSAQPAHAAEASIPAGLKYVALGSSFAAGPGIPSPQPGTPAACGRSTNNYASLVAREHAMELTDVTCGGATTADVLTNRQNGLPPQVEAVTADADLVSVTIGGNDVNYLGSIGALSCRHGATPENCGTVDRDDIDRKLDVVGERIKNVVNAVHDRAPDARVLVVDYLTIVPGTGDACTGVPLDADDLAFERGLASRLAAATRQAAAQTGATLVDAAAAGAWHHACADRPWIEKYAPTGRVGYHPNEAGMAAVARLIGRALCAFSPTR